MSCNFLCVHRLYFAPRPSRIQTQLHSTLHSQLSQLRFCVDLATGRVGLCFCCGSRAAGVLDDVAVRSCHACWALSDLLELLPFRPPLRRQSRTPRIDFLDKSVRRCTCLTSRKVCQAALPDPISSDLICCNVWPPKAVVIDVTLGFRYVTIYVLD